MTITLFPHRPRMGGLPLRISAILLVLSAACLRASPWEDMSAGLFNEAHAEFVKEEKAAGADLRLLRFGEAVSLLNVQPRTQSNIDKAFSILEEVRTARPSDDLALESRYLQGRIEQVQRATPDLAKADAIYSELIAAHPRHPVAQRAQVKLAIIRLYAGVDGDERRRRFDEFSRIAGELTEPGVKSQMHLLLAETAKRLRYDYAIELDHLLAAHKAGVAKRRLLGDVLVRIGELGRLTGRKEIAREFYSQFLAQFPRSDRRSTIEAFLAALNSPTS